MEALGHEHIGELRISIIKEKMNLGIYVLLLFFLLKAPTTSIATEPKPIRRREAAPDIAIPFFNAFITAVL